MALAFRRSAGRMGTGTQGMKPETRFAAFRNGEAPHLPDMAAGKAYHGRMGTWP